MKKVISLMMALAMSLSLCVGAFATENGVKETTVYDLGNGIFAVVTIESGENRIRPRTGLTFTETINAKKTHNYNLISSDGDCGFIWVTNEEDEDSGIQMKVTYQFTINGETVTFDPKIVDPGDIAKVTFHSNTSSGIDGRAVTTVQPYRAASVTYTYELDQYWS